ncbi:MAG: tannase/feruloyl esterase family alpha/beta hydrolase [Lautropia sp.]
MSNRHPLIRDPLSRHGVGAVVAASAFAIAAPAFASESACSALSGTVGTATPERVQASFLEAGKARAGGGERGTPLAAHCLVKAQLAPHVGVGGRKFHTGVELRMPEDWNGRFLYLGGGGNDGVVREASGAIASGLGADPALNRGYAIVTTDAGHQGTKASEFGIDPVARVDHAYAAHDRTARFAKATIARYYGKAAERSYFFGCSGGGRQGMMFTQRFPDYFDGVIAMAPAMRVSSGATIASAWNAQEFRDAAPLGADGKPQTHAAFSDAALGVVAKGVLNACDATDGLADGMVANPTACRFDPTSIACPADKSETCLDAKQVKAMQRYLDGPKDGSGKALYFPQMADPAIAQDGWRLWALGTEKQPSRYVFLMQDALRHEFITPPAPDLDMLRFDFDRDPERMKAFSWIYDTYADAKLDAFRAHGGKLMIVHGTADPIFSAHESVDYFMRAADALGGVSKAQEAMRLFLVPGMNHCRGGIGTDDFDALASMVGWVERNEAPARIEAKVSPANRATPNRGRPLCAYPAWPRYDGTGDKESAASFACATE